MITPTRRQTKPPRIQRIHINSWEAGTVSAFDDSRTPIKGLRHSENLMLDQNSILKPRPGMMLYGPPRLGKRLGEVFEFRVTTSDGSVNWLACLQHVEGETKLCVAKGEDLAWTVIPGKVYHDTARGHFLQSKQKVVVMNGEDLLSYLDTTTMTLMAFTPIADPSAGPTLNTNTGLSGSGFKVFYAITANSSVGETAGSAVLQQAVPIDRDMWNPDTQSIKIQWAAVTGAKSYNVYVGIGVDGGGQPTLYRVAQGLPSDQLEFTDNGTRALDLSAPMPEDNSTAGPRATRGCVSNGRVFLVGDKDHPFYVWRGGDYGHELDFSPSNGGGYTPVGDGTKEIPVAVKHNPDGKGNAKTTVLSRGTNGQGRRYFLGPAQVTYGSTTLTVWEVTEDVGTDGTDSPDSVILYNNSLHYLSSDGGKTTGIILQLQNMLSTRRTTGTIQDAIAAFNTNSMDLAVGLPYEGRLYYSVAANSSYNNQIWVCDTERKGAWMKPWTIAAEWLTLYNDNSGRTHFLAAKENDEIYEITSKAKTVDVDNPFVTSGISGQIRFSEDGRDWGRVHRVTFVLMRPQGTINFSVSGRTEDGVLPFNERRTFGSVASRAGWGEPRAGWGRRGWSRIRTIPKTFNAATEEVEIEVDEDMQWLQYGWNTTDVGVDYGISDVIVEYTNVGRKDLS